VKPRDRLLHNISKQSKGANYAFIAVAFVKRKPLESLFGRLRRSLNNGAKIDFFTSGFLDITAPEALQYLYSQKKKGVRPYFQLFGRFHAKFLYFQKPHTYSLFVGSSNISDSGLLEEGELNMEVSGSRNRQDQVYRDLQVVMKKIRADEDFQPVTNAVIKKYAKRFRSSATRRTERMNKAEPSKRHPRVPGINRSETWPIAEWREYWSKSEERKINRKHPEWRRYDKIEYSGALSRLIKKGEGYFLGVRPFKTTAHFSPVKYVDHDWIDKEVGHVVFGIWGKSSNLNEFASKLGEDWKMIVGRGYFSNREIRLLLKRYKNLFPKNR
jgi:HKD family nuclease